MATRFRNDSDFDNKLDKLKQERAKEKDAEKQKNLDTEIAKLEEMGKGGQAIIDRQTASRILAGFTDFGEQQSRVSEIISDAFLEK